MNELENLRMDVYKENNLLESFKHQNSVQEKVLEQISGNQELKYLGKPANERAFPKSVLNPSPPPLHVRPMMNHTSHAERTHENVPSLAPYLSSARPSTEQQHRDFLDYRHKLYDRSAMVSPDSKHLARTHNRPISMLYPPQNDSQEVYKKILENTFRVGPLPE